MRLHGTITILEACVISKKIHETFTIKWILKELKGNQDQNTRG